MIFLIPDNNFNKGHRLLIFCVGSQKDTSEMFSSFRTLPGSLSRSNLKHMTLIIMEAEITMSFYYGSRFYGPNSKDAILGRCSMRNPSIRSRAFTTGFYNRKVHDHRLIDLHCPNIQMQPQGSRPWKMLKSVQGHPLLVTILLMNI